MNNLISIVIFTSAVILVAETRHHGQGSYLRIARGDGASSHKHKYEVAILGDDNKLICTGSLISKKHVLTAAHPFDGMDMKKLKVQVGSHRLNAGGELIEVSDSRRHEDYVPNNHSDNDIAVLKLARKVKDPNAVPISLPRGDIIPDLHIQVSGWGKYKKTDDNTSNDLLAIWLPILSKGTCKEAYGRFGLDTNDHVFCAGIDGSALGPCDGDGGAPAVYEDEIYGLASWGYGCENPGIPSLFVNVFQYKEWIKKAKSQLQ